MTRKLTVVALGLAVFALIGSAIGNSIFKGEQSKQVQSEFEGRDAEQLAKFADLRARWRDAIRLAASTPREQLVGPIAKLQELRREADQIYLFCDPINGLGTYRAGMDRGIDAILRHMREGRGAFDEAGLDWMQERLGLASKQLAEACGV